MLYQKSKLKDWLNGCHFPVPLQRSQTLHNFSDEAEKYTAFFPVIRGVMFGLVMAFFVQSINAQALMEDLDRGVVAVPQKNDNVFVSWRLLGSDPAEIAFNLYRKANHEEWKQVNRQPISESTNFVDKSVEGTKEVSYRVHPVIEGNEQSASKSFSPDFAQPYLSVPLQTPEGYTPNDASVGDLDGDGQYEIVLHQTGESRDNSQSGFTDPPIIDAYTMDGKLLWRINLGKNIREGAHYTQFIVYDLDSDGKAEIAMKTADGAVDGEGAVIGDSEADYRNEEGYILAGPEYLTVFDGETGAELATTDYIPPRHPNTLFPSSEQLDEIWGDGYGNRMDRFLAGVAYLDGKRPSLIMARGYYTRSVIAAWNWRDGTLTHQWTFDSNDGTPGHEAYRGQGNHQLSIADVDGDGKDEIIYGSAAIDHDGEGLYSTGLGHGDALHVFDLDPDHPGQEVFNIQERFDDAGVNVRDAATGEILWKKPSIKVGDDGEGPGRGNAFDIDPRHPGAETWVHGANIEGLFNVKGQKISDQKPSFCNFGVWWDGDLLRELLDRNVIAKWDWNTGEVKPLFVAEGAVSNNGTKATPALSGDILGDWREEVMLRSENNDELRIYTTSIPTSHRMPTLLHDRQYRLGLAWQNVAYNQPPHPGFYIGENMDEITQPDIKIVK